VPVRVFHVDDSESYRLLVSQMFAPEDIEVVGGAGDAEAAISGVATAKPDAVLLDQIGGPELIERLREVAPGARVVLLSGYPQSQASPDAVAAADAYVEKSGDLQKLCEALVTAVRA
jgi:DNA-binding NarL/FixJ family response regulator